MKCPACNEPQLIVADRDGIKVDYCPECRGVWLERGELDKFVARSAEEGEPLDRETLERIERHRDEHRRHLGRERRESTRLAERIFDF